MPELQSLHLPDTYLHMVQAVLRQHAPDAAAWAYGSRVNGDHHEASDIDLVLRHPGAQPCPPGQLDTLREAFSDSNLPILVQVVDWARIPAAFRAEIEAGYVVLQVGN
jgi:predicted nucleotidyltransferase